MSLRSILGGSKVKKRTASNGGSASPSPSQRWPASARRTKPGATPALRRHGSSSEGKTTSSNSKVVEDYLAERLSDHGLVTTLATDLSLRDVTQALRHVRQRMFDPLPAQASGMGSARTGEVLRFRRALPQVVSAAHVAVFLRSATAAEREMDELVRAGHLVRVVVPRRGGVGEVLVEMEELERLVRGSNVVGEEAGRAFMQWVRKGRREDDDDLLEVAVVDELVRGGFLTGQHLGAQIGDVFARPEDRITFVSLEAVSRAASGTVAAVGGGTSLRSASGGGGSAGHRGTAPRQFTLALPGMGIYLKVATAALAHIESILARSPYREAPEYLLREKWDGGLSQDDQLRSARAARGEFRGILPGRTRKWKEFYGLSFDWVLGEALSTGMIELFETGSVGRGVRLIG